MLIFGRLLHILFEMLSVTPQKLAASFLFSFDVENMLREMSIAFESLSFALETSSGVLMMFIEFHLTCVEWTIDKINIPSSQIL